jgi:type VI secretion system ImpM family protein
MTPAYAHTGGWIGKLPSRAEYLPVPSWAPAFAAFDAWLTTSIEWAAARAGADWTQRFAGGAVHGFVFRSPVAAPDEVLCGALAPSRDSAGRQFPLALAAPLRLPPEVVVRPELLPFLLETVWSEATRALVEALETGNPELAGAIQLEPAADVAEAAGLYAEWAAQLPLAELWALLGPALGDPRATLRLLFETLAPVRQVERPATTLSLRLPLGQASGLGLCFWLDLVRRGLGWQRTVPNLFWSHDGSNGAVMLHLGAAPKATLAELWMPTGGRDEIADLTLPPPRALVDVLPALSAAVEGTLASGDASVAAFLQSLGG